jgi:D-alanyl-D-alanine carboxypeptidase
MNKDFARTREAQWMEEHCQEFGFVLRYMEDKEESTGIKFEPWHFRYVGKKAATYIMDHDLTLEEFVHQLREKEAKDGKVDSKENNEETKQSKKFEKKDQNTSR